MAANLPRARHERVLARGRPRAALTRRNVAWWRREETRGDESAAGGARRRRPPVARARQAGTTETSTPSSLTVGRRYNMPLPGCLTSRQSCSDLWDSVPRIGSVIFFSISFLQLSSNSSFMKSSQCQVCKNIRSTVLPTPPARFRMPQAAQQQV